MGRGKGGCGGVGVMGNALTVSRESRQPRFRNASKAEQGRSDDSHPTVSSRPWSKLARPEAMVFRRLKIRKAKLLTP